MDRVKLDTAKLDEILRTLRPEASKIVEKWGWKITGESAKKAPVDTSALRNSLLSESGMAGENDALIFILQDGVEYGIHQELGTSRMAAHPFVIPALEENKKDFGEAFKELFK